MRRSLFILFFIPFCLSAQIDKDDTLKVKASLSLTGLVQAGNVQTLIFNAKSDISIKAGKRWVYQNKNSYIYQAFGGNKADEDILVLNFLYFNPQRKLYPQLLAIVSTNFRRRIDLRSLWGAGITYQILTEKNNWLKMSLSSEYEQTNFNEVNFNIDEYDGSEDVNTARGTVWLNGNHQLFDKKMVFKHESYFQTSLERANNFRWRTNLALEFPIWKFLSFKVNYIYAFESLVIETQEQGDTFLTFGFTLKNF